jgi:hypothetical protein
VKEGVMAWREGRVAWDRFVAESRPRYVAEIHRLATRLRGKFERKEIGGVLDALEPRRVRGRATDEDSRPYDRLWELCGRHFGLLRSDWRAARVVLSVSPSADWAVAHESGSDPPTIATAAAAQDVQALAIALGWSVPDKERAESVPSKQRVLWWARAVARKG